jgi:16S rRNA (cytidine1402-2'-O)-methyltransferase
VAEAHRAGIRVSPVPGPSAAAAALSASGFAAPRFLFAGFCLRRRRAAQGARALECRGRWIYEAPHRSPNRLRDLRENSAMRGSPGLRAS